MLVLGIILLLLGYLLGVHVLFVIGGILAAVGALLLVLGGLGRPVGGRRYWY
ncbi:hypothetical protein Cali_87 [Mycobacterium phage Cali]|uniref:Uncharacterized protein n=40 Tax=Bixzunavirus TaxID=680114 RepID=G1BSY8_9CAUD|nr:hypothetical protein SCOTTMCG_89 [Mycobacterium phage ScottMcG]YP_002224341.1 gp92 [Mycobacterium phage Spud]YP_002224560.1 gp87 [Mycobacterium phage Cali]YP_003347760.1 hypothetical protein ET08_81 [Mycobacterium phage ET08]YP_008060890.1 hypothetical protein M181_gp237 [Mycobacterium phage Gizmo]YP_008061347.1 hypothetical protein M180_gp233 [Mycobacterium phage ArcherS7]YP_008061582.1 hypothetical protein M182_gp228 [Mycobacterium phage Astraea]YP_009012873.1 hypothetical protein DANDE